MMKKEKTVETNDYGITMGAAKRFCSNFNRKYNICASDEPCKPKICDYFKQIVMPCWLSYIKRIKKKSWNKTKEYKKYQKIEEILCQK